MRARTYAGANAGGASARGGVAIAPATGGGAGPETGTVIPVSAAPANSSRTAGAATSSPGQTPAQRLRELLSLPPGPTPPPAASPMLPPKTAPPRPAPHPPPPNPPSCHQ